MAEIKVAVFTPGRADRWEIPTGTFNMGALRHSLFVISDLSGTLREEERQAWQRLVRVLGHEINNSPLRRSNRSPHC